MAVAAATLLAPRRVEEPSELKLDNPLQLRTALTFGVLLTVIPLVAAGAERWAGQAGVYVTAFAAGLADVDAITLSLARAAGRSVDADTAERAIVVAVLANTLAKSVLATAIGGVPMLRWASSILLTALLVGAATAIVTLG